MFTAETLKRGNTINHQDGHERNWLQQRVRPRELVRIKRHITNNTQGISSRQKISVA